MARRWLALALVPAFAWANDYRAGQIWQYHTRPGEEQSRLYIVKTDTLRDGAQAFHIHIDHIAIRNAHLAGGIQTDLPHAPVSAQTLDESVTRLDGTTDELPDISEGYAVWREAYDAGRGGVFTLPVAQLLDLVQQTADRYADAPL